MPEYLLEYQVIGNSVKVSAIDPVSGLEVATVGPVSAGETLLKQQAIRKLNYVKSKRQEQLSCGRAGRDRGMVV